MPQPLTLTRREASLALLSAGLALATPAARPWRVLLVAAHPDDEYYFAATTYRLAQELDAVVDHVVLSNGEGGYRYSTLAEKYYGCKLTDEVAGRARLPEIRRRETLAAGKVLGVRKHYFFDQPDQRFTLDIEEALGRLWDVDRLRRSLHDLLERERYDFVFTLLPRTTTHGHHQAATLLLAEVVAGLPSDERPVILAADTGPAAERPTYAAPAEQPLFRTSSAEPVVEFDRRAGFGYENALDYAMVVNWVVAEHKSQGMFQKEWGKDDCERFWQLAAAPPDAAARVNRLRDDLTRPRKAPSRLASERPGATR